MWVVPENLLVDLIRVGFAETPTALLQGGVVMEDDSCSRADTRRRVPGTNFHRTSSPHSCYSAREITA